MSSLTQGQRGLAYNLIADLQKEPLQILKNMDVINKLGMAFRIVRRNVMLEELDREEEYAYHNRYYWQVQHLVEIMNDIILKSKFYVKLTQEKIIEVLEMVHKYFGVEED